MNARERFLFGAAGASAPSMLNLVLIDAGTVLGSLTGIVLLVYLLRIIVLAALGGLVSWGQKDLGDAWKCIQVGIAAPALFMAGLNGIQVARHAETLGAIAFAQAATPVCDRAHVRYFALPVETKQEQVERGLYGRQSARTWFVILQYHFGVETARDQAALVLQRRIFRTVDVFCAPTSRQPAVPFAVVVGENLLLADAEGILSRANALGYINAVLFNVAAGGKR